jgi:hypothetical protein
VGDEPRGDVDVFDADGNWMTAWAGVQECFANYLIEDWGPVFGWASYTWRDGHPPEWPPVDPPEDPPIDPE